MIIGSAGRSFELRSCLRGEKKLQEGKASKKREWLVCLAPLASHDVVRLGSALEPLSTAASLASADCRPRCTEIQGVDMAFPMHSCDWLGRLAVGSLHHFRTNGLALLLELGTA